jgi:hypothetical protein
MLLSNNELDSVRRENCFRMRKDINWDGVEKPADEVLAPHDSVHRVETEVAPNNDKRRVSTTHIPIQLFHYSAFWPIIL